MISDKCLLYITPISGLGELSNFIGKSPVLIIHHIMERQYCYEYLINFNEKKNFISNEISKLYYKNCFLGLTPFTDHERFVYLYSEHDKIYNAIKKTLI